MTNLSKIIKSDFNKLKNEIEVSSVEGESSPSQIAEGRERAIKDVFVKYFPSSHKITKGIISDSHAMKSSEIDLVILSPDHPNLERSGKMAFIIADETDVAIEIKGNLTKNELNRGLKQINSVKKLRRIISDFEYNLIVKNIISDSPKKNDSYLTRICSGIICHKICDIDNLVSDTINYYLNKNIPFTDWIDFIASLDGHIICFNGNGHKGMNKTYPHINTISVNKYEEDFLEKFLSLIFIHINGNSIKLKTNYIQNYINLYHNEQKDKTYLLFNIDDFMSFCKNQNDKIPTFRDIHKLPYNSKPDSCYNPSKGIFCFNKTFFQFMKKYPDFKIESETCWKFFIDKYGSV